MDISHTGTVKQILVLTYSTENVGHVGSKFLDNDYLVCDCRDDDIAGGMITNAFHTPDSTFVQDFEKLLKVIYDKKPSVLIFHCMESLRRGPRCAKRASIYFESCAEIRYNPEIRVLRGGFDRWVRRYFRDPQRVCGYLDEYWGFEEVEKYDTKNVSHRLYDPNTHR